MTQEQKAKAYDEALERARKQREEYQKEFDKTDKNSRLASILRAAISAVEMAFPELAESEDERIRRELMEFVNWAASRGSVRNDWLIKKCPEKWVAYLEKMKENPKSADSILSDCVSDVKWADTIITRVIVALSDDVDYNMDEPCKYRREINDLKKLREVLCGQKEQNEELVYRLNGLMQDYIKEGKDDEEKEHRLKCYQLFWNALEDTNFFEQKEQKPVESISQLAVQGKGVYKICPRCKERMIRDDSMVYTSMPPQYRYECPKCGKMECDTVMYDNPEMEEQKPADLSEMMVHKEPYIAPVPTPMVADEQKHILKFKVGDKVHLEGDDVNILTITGIEKDRYLTDNSYGPILFGAEDIWERIEQKPVDYEAELKKCKDNPLYFYDKYVSIKQKPVKPSGKLSRQDYLYQLLIDQLITYSDYEYLIEHKPAEWSEEDERMKNDKHFLSICQHLETLISESKNDETKDSIDKDYRWLCEFYRKSRSAPNARPDII